MAVRARHFDALAVLLDDLLDGDWRAFHTVRRDGRIDIRHGQRGCLNGTDDHWRVERVGRVDVLLSQDRIVVADGFRRIRDRAQANLLCHGRLRGVMRFDQALQRGFPADGATFGVVQRPCAVSGELRAVEGTVRVTRVGSQGFVDGMPLQHPGDHVNRLPRGADVKADTSPVFLVDRIVDGCSCRIGFRRIRRIIGSIDPKAEHFARPRFYRSYRHFEACGVIDRNGVPRGFHRGVIRVDVHRGVDFQAALVQQLLPGLRGFAEFLGIEDLVGHVAAEERGIAGHLTPLLHGLDVQRIFQRGGFGFVVLRFRDELLLKHQVQHNISLFFSGFLIGLD